ncbi:MAG: hypothetical protein H0X34_02035 [Chthoniobacterales bacterium]|nr:hypothetical protein [Chthoniobacterales bacterium]
MDASLGKTSVIPSGARDLTTLADRPLPAIPGVLAEEPRAARDDKAQNRSETAAHLQLKRLALLWAQENGYPICALEVALPQCRYRADVAAYRPERNGNLGLTAVFECKQSTSDLRRNDCRSPEALARLETVYRRRQILEKHLRIHYPTLRTGDTLFPEWEAHDFDAIEHRGYRRANRELAALQRQLRDGRKFEKLARYACANLFFLVVPNDLLREPETPPAWGLLVEKAGVLALSRKPAWHDSSAAARLRLLQKVAAAGTRLLNRQHDLSPINPYPHASVEIASPMRKHSHALPHRPESLVR